MQNIKEQGKLYGIGVGPGDPELMPIKAVNILKSVGVIFCASSSKNNHSLAINIAQPYLPPETPITKLAFPMTMDKEVAQKAWLGHVETIIRELRQGKDAAFLTLGDPLTYSTYGYLLQCMQDHAPEISIETVPGITSFQAAAAATNTTLVEGEESLLVLSGVQGGDKLRQMSNQVDNVVFLKAYKNISDICGALEETGRMDSSVGVVRCGFPDQGVFQDIRKLCQQEPKYWTLIISKPSHEQS